MTRTIGIGVIGLGWMGVVHAVLTVRLQIASPIVVSIRDTSSVRMRSRTEHEMHSGDSALNTTQLTGGR